MLFYIIKSRQHDVTTPDTSGLNCAAYELRSPGFDVTPEANLFGIPQ
jgi:hypothetical protein